MVLQSPDNECSIGIRQVLFRLARSIRVQQALHRVLWEVYDGSTKRCIRFLERGCSSQFVRGGGFRLSGLGVVAQVEG